MLRQQVSELKTHSHIFLTGVTGVLGAHLLKELLESTDSDIYCLTRGETQEIAEDRVLSFLKSYDTKLVLKEAFLRRVHVILGDVSSPQLGLSDALYQELTEKIDATLHVAALTNLFVNYRRIHPINVLGTENIIKFALKTSQKYLCHISTHTIMGNSVFDKNLSFKESDLDIGQTFEYMTYQKSKFIAEQMVRDATKDGLIWNIIRPGQIFGDSRTGLYPQGLSNVTGLFYDIFKTVIETGVGLISKTHFDVVPVDYVSKGTILLGLKRPHYFETYHLTNPHVKRYSEVLNLLGDQGYHIDLVSEEKYKQLLFTNGLYFKGQEYKSPTVSAFKWWYKKEIFSFEDSCVTDCRYTEGLLKTNGLTCAKVDSNLMGTYIDEAIRWNYFPKRPLTIPRAKVATALPLKEQAL